MSAPSHRSNTYSASRSGVAVVSGTVTSTLRDSYVEFAPQVRVVHEAWDMGITASTTPTAFTIVTIVSLATAEPSSSTSLGMEGKIGICVAVAAFVLIAVLLWTLR